MGKVINFPGVEKTIRTLDYERAHAVSLFKERTDPNVLDVREWACISRYNLWFYIIHTIALAAAFMMLGVGMANGNPPVIIIALGSVILNVVLIAIYFRAMVRDLKKAEKTCHAHVHDNGIFDDAGNLRKW